MPTAGKPLADQLIAIAAQVRPLDLPSAPNSPPVAKLAGPTSAPQGTVVTLDASGSSDPDGDKLTFGWAQTAGPVVVLTYPVSAKASFVAPTAPAQLSFRVTVTDAKGATSVASLDFLATVPAIPVPPDPQPTGAYGPRNISQPIGSISAAPGQIAAKLAGVAVGGTLWLTPGVYAKEAIPAKAGVKVVGALGAVIDGGNTLASGVTGSVAGFTVENVEFRNFKNAAQQPVIDGRNLPGLILRNIALHRFTGTGLCGGNGGTLEGFDLYDGNQLGLMANNSGGVIRNGRVSSINVVGSATQTNPNQVKIGTRWFYEPGWEAGGSKFWATNGLTVSGLLVVDCGGPGIWFDTSNSNYVVDNNEIARCDWAGSDNSANGIFIEVSHGGKISNNYVHECGTKWHPWVWNGGIQIAASDGVEVFNNRVVNCGNGITMPTQARNDNGTTWATKNNSIHDNTVTGKGFSGAATDGGPSPFPATANNKWLNNHYSGGHLFAWNGHDGLSWAQWQAAGQDKTGTYA